MAISPIAYGPPIATGGGGGGGAPVDATYITRTADATLTAETALSALATGILKSTTGTGALSIAGASDLPAAGAGAGTYGAGGNVVESVTLDAQGRVTGTTTVAAGGGGGAPVGAKYIVQTADATLTAEQALGALATGILKSTTTTGVLSIATSADYVVPGGAAGGQTINGDTAASGNLTLSSTSNGTKGRIYFGPGSTNYFHETGLYMNLGGGLVLNSANLNFDNATGWSQIFNMGASAASSLKFVAGGVNTMSMTATQVQTLVSLVADGTGLTTVDPLVIKNGKASSGVIAQVTGSVATGFGLNNSGGTRVGTLGIAVAASDWFTGTSAGDIALYSTANIKIKVSGSSGLHAALMSSGCSTLGVGGGYCYVNDTAGAVVGYGGKHTTWDGTNMIMVDAMNIATGTGTGMKIGTSATQKLGFWNVTPVAQQVLATGASRTVDEVITLLQLIGLCKQS